MHIRRNSNNELKLINKRNENISGSPALEATLANAIILAY